MECADHVLHWVEVLSQKGLFPDKHVDWAQLKIKKQLAAEWGNPTGIYQRVGTTLYSTRIRLKTYCAAFSSSREVKKDPE